MLKTWNNFSIGWKYGTAFLISITLFIASAILIFIQVGQVKGAMDVQVEKSNRAVQLTELASLFRAKDMRIANYIILPTKSSLEEYEEVSAKFSEMKDNFGETLVMEEHKAMFAKVIENDQKLDEVFSTAIIPAVEKELKYKYLTARMEATKLRTENVRLFDELREIVTEEMIQAESEGKAILNKSIMTLVVSIIVSALLGIILMYFVNRIVQRNVNQVIATANEISKGNFSIPNIPAIGNDEIGKLASGINAMKVSLKEILEKVAQTTDLVTEKSNLLTQTTEEVRQGSRQIATTMQELASGSESQASNSNQLSELMDSFSQTINQVNQNGEHLQQSSKGVLKMSQEGSQLMQTSVGQMKTIDEIVKSSVTKVQSLDKMTGEISTLIKVIREIADQTNLLALNAAIEAARAGEHGRGFAVVADEVRKLAEQVSLSVVDITTIVDRIQTESNIVVESLEHGYKEVDEGSKQIELTGQTFQKITENVSEMANNIDRISDSLKELSASSQQMNQSIQEVASVSEESAASIEEVSASVQESTSSMEEISDTADTLATEARSLKEQMKRFTI